jgi:hypothetical protein
LKEQYYMAGLTLESILSDLQSVEDAGVTKTASEATKSEAARADLMGALERAKEATKSASAKTAGAKPAVSELNKIASDLADAKDAALRKEAELYGSCVADGFVARLSQFQESTKTAAVEVDSIEKLAAAYPELVKQAIEFGHNNAVENLAQDPEFLKSAAAGYNDTMKEIEKTASDCFDRGYNDARAVVEAIWAQA